MIKKNTPLKNSSSKDTDLLHFGEPIWISKRKPYPIQTAPHLKPYTLVPQTFLKTLEQSFQKDFQEDLKKIPYQTHFRADGFLFLDEWILTISLIFENKRSATTFYASIDPDAKKQNQTSKKQNKNNLFLCAEAISSLLGSFFSSSKKSPPLSALYAPTLPLHPAIAHKWQPYKIKGSKKVFLKIDKTHPELEAATLLWLKKHS